MLQTLTEIPTISGHKQNCYDRREKRQDIEKDIIIYTEEYTEWSGTNEGIQRTTEAGDTKAGGLQILKKYRDGLRAKKREETRMRGNAQKSWIGEFDRDECLLVCRLSAVTGKFVMSVGSHGHGGVQNSRN